MCSDTHNCSSSNQGTLWKIDRSTTHDGPGIRTALYFKGCPLQCKFCSNPEGQFADPVLVFQESKCSDCGFCLEACPLDALERQSPAKIHIDRSRCKGCNDCVSKCPTAALQLYGQSYTVPDVLRLLEKDRMIHRRSGGGLSCTGGDPLNQGEFLLELLEQCRRHGIHSAIETCAYADESLFRRVLGTVDWLFIDLKHIDSRKHLELTGKSNQLILSNARLASAVLRERGKKLILRQVVVPGVTDGRNIEDLGDFAVSLPFLTGVELLAYHHYGVHKYDLLGLTYSLKETRPPTADEMGRNKETLRNRGLMVM